VHHEIFLSRGGHAHNISVEQAQWTETTSQLPIAIVTEAQLQEGGINQMPKISMTAKAQSHRNLDDQHQQNEDKNVSNQIATVIAMPHLLTHPQTSAAQLMTRKTKTKQNGKNGAQSA
jgi:hypothetical protein